MENIFNQIQEKYNKSKVFTRLTYLVQQLFSHLFQQLPHASPNYSIFLPIKETFYKLSQTFDEQSNIPF